MRWIWTPRFEHTFCLGIACMVFDAIYLFACHHYDVMYMRTIIPTFLALGISKIPIFIVSKVKFDRMLVWMSCSSVLLSVLFIAICSIVLLSIRSKKSPPPLAVFGFFLVAAFFDGWLLVNVAILSVLLIRDVTLPSDPSSLTK